MGLFCGREAEVGGFGSCLGFGDVLFLFTQCRQPRKPGPLGCSFGLK